MQVFSLKFLRTFILLLLTVFITDTVYASSKMVADMIAGQQDSQSISKAASHAVHCQNMQAEQAHVKSHEKSNSHAGSQHCSHCIACFSMIVQEKLSLKTLQATPSVIPAFVKIYHAPFRAQPQKPPIV